MGADKMTAVCSPETERPPELAGWRREISRGTSETISQPQTHSFWIRSSPVPHADLHSIREALEAQPWFVDVAERLIRFLSYEANWNGYGEKPISKQAVKSTIIVLHRVAIGGPEPVVVPVSNGGIQVEWYHSGTEIEVEISPSGLMSIFIEFSDGRNSECEPRHMNEPIWDELRTIVASMKAR